MIKAIDLLLWLMLHSLAELWHKWDRVDDDAGGRSVWLTRLTLRH